MLIGCFLEFRLVGSPKRQRRCEGLKRAGHTIVLLEAANAKAQLKHERAGGRTPSNARAKGLKAEENA